MQRDYSGEIDSREGSWEGFPRSPLVTRQRRTQERRKAWKWKSENGPLGAVRGRAVRRLSAHSKDTEVKPKRRTIHITQTTPLHLQTAVVNFIKLVPRQPHSAHIFGRLHVLLKHKSRNIETIQLVGNTSSRVSENNGRAFFTHQCHQIIEYVSYF